MKYLKVLLFLVLCMNGLAVQAKCGQFALKQLSVDRFTDIGGGQVRWEQGSLQPNQPFVPLTSANYNALSIFNLTPDVLAQVNGQFVVPLAEWQLYDTVVPGGEGLCNYSKSAATYSIDNVPHVIVSGKQATVKKPKVSISAVDPSASETAGDTGQFLITLNAPSAKTIRVKLQTSGKAKKNRDYTGIPKNVVVPSGNVSAIVEVLPIDDTAAEGPEDVKVKISSGGNAYSALGGNRGRASVVINDND
jgi:hypothetical protein